MSARNVFVTGIPNAGKTTLFNGLTGKNERVGNWCGVTTKAVRANFSVREKKIGKTEIKRFTAVDLPGSYFDDYTLEQKETARTITGGGIVLVVCQAVNLKNGLDFLKKVIAFGLPTAFVINAYAEFSRGGGSIDVKALENKIGVPVVVAECNAKKGVETVKAAILSLNRFEKLLVPRPFDSREVADSVVKKKSSVGFYACDRFLLDPRISASVILLSSIIVLYEAFGSYGIGTLSVRLIESFFGFAIYAPAVKLLAVLGASPFITGFVLDGVLGGALSVLAFLPRLAVLSLFTGIIEESGILARFAFSCDRFLSRFGLSGRAVFALMTGFGCTAVAVSSACGLENEKIRKTAALSLPFVCCSAKVPVIVFLAGELATTSGFSAVLLVWVTGLFSCFLFSAAQTAVANKEKTELIVEFPKYRVPPARVLLKNLLAFSRNFIVRVGSVIAVVTAFLWILKSVSPDMRFLTDEAIEESILVAVAEKFRFVFYPGGVDNWRFVVAALAGLFAKENVFSVLSLLGTGGASGRELVAFAAYFVLYPPCISALATIFMQEGVKSFLHVTAFHFYLAFAAFWSVMKPYYAVLFVLPAAYVIIKKRINEKRRNDEKIYGRKRNRVKSVSSR